MRILAGKMKYKRLNYKKDEKLRPTKNIVRKSFFDTVAPAIEGSVFLDLFAGVGSMGIEALSRGAKEAIFVDNSSRSVDIIKRNVEEAGCKDSSVVLRKNAYEFNNDPRLEKVDLVYIDAPYDFDVNRFLAEFFKFVNPNAIVCVEHSSKKPPKDSFGKFVKFKTRNFGKSTLSYFGVVDE